MEGLCDTNTKWSETGHMHHKTHGRVRNLEELIVGKFKFLQRPEFVHFHRNKDFFYTFISNSFILACVMIIWSLPTHWIKHQAVPGHHAHTSTCCHVFNRKLNILKVTHINRGWTCKPLHRQQPLCSRLTLGPEAVTHHVCIWGCDTLITLHDFYKLVYLLPKCIWKSQRSNMI